MNAQDTPDTLRARLKERRRQIDAQDRQRGALLIRGRLFTWLATRRTALRNSGGPSVCNIAAFWSMADEPALQPLLRQWAADESLNVSLPVVIGPGQALEFYLWTPEMTMHTGAYGIQEPPRDQPAPRPDVVLVPTLGFTRAGDRIGYGGGYYDRTLAALRIAGHPFVALGIAWASGDLGADKHVPASHDQKLDGILTDKGWALPVPALPGQN